MEKQSLDLLMSPKAAMMPSHIQEFLPGDSKSPNGGSSPGNIVANPLEASLKSTERVMLRGRTKIFKEQREF